MPMRFVLEPSVSKKMSDDYTVYFAVLSGLEFVDDDQDQFQKWQADFRKKQDGVYPHKDVLDAWQTAFANLDLLKSGVQVSLANMLDRIVIDGKDLAPVHPLVDFYNQFVLEQGIAVGAYDLDRVGEEVTLKMATGNETFLQLGKSEYVNVEPDEVILTDENETMCRFWVWKQSETTKIRKFTKNILFRFEVQGMDRPEAELAILKFLEAVKGKFAAKSADFVKLNAAKPEAEIALPKLVIESKARLNTVKELMHRGVAEVNVYDDLTEKLLSGLKLRIKFGIDPTGADLTLGHAVPLRKLKQFQQAGHQIVLLFGTFTGQIGDPTGKSQTRKQLTKDDVLQNTKTYLEQAAKILDTKDIELVYNHEWLEGMSFADVLQLAGNFTVAQMLERDMFHERMKNGKEINLVEFMYPLMQGYDSVPIKADVEIGGTDQLFNMMCARPIQKRFGLEPQNVMTVPLMVGLDGKEKMSKSLGNYIALNDSAKDMYGKTMSIPDHLIVNYFELATDLPMTEIKEIETMLHLGSINPRDLKMRLAREIVTEFYDAEAAKYEEEQFITVFQKGELPDEIPLFEFDEAEMPIIELLLKCNLIATSSEGRRLIDGGGLKLNDAKVTDINLIVDLASENLLQAGKRKFARVGPR